MEISKELKGKSNQNVAEKLDNSLIFVVDVSLFLCVFTLNTKPAKNIEISGQEHNFESKLSIFLVIKVSNVKHK